MIFNPLQSLNRRKEKKTRLQNHYCDQSPRCVMRRALNPNPEEEQSNYEPTARTKASSASLSTGLRRNRAILLRAPWRLKCEGWGVECRAAEAEHRGWGCADGLNSAFGVWSKGNHRQHLQLLFQTRVLASPRRTRQGESGKE